MTEETKLCAARKKSKLANGFYRPEHSRFPLECHLGRPFAWVNRQFQNKAPSRPSPTCLRCYCYFLSGKKIQLFSSAYKIGWVEKNPVWNKMKSQVAPIWGGLWSQLFGEVRWCMDKSPPLPLWWWYPHLNSTWFSRGGLNYLGTQEEEEGKDSRQLLGSLQWPSPSCWSSWRQVSDSSVQRKTKDHHFVFF